MTSASRTLRTLLAVGTAGVLVLAGCSSDSDSTQAGGPRPEQPATAPESPAVPDSASPSDPAATPDAAAPAPDVASPAGETAATATPGPGANPKAAASPKSGSGATSGGAAAAAGTPAAPRGAAGAPAPRTPGAPAPRTPGAPAPQAGAPGGGATDVGVTADQIKLGSIFMYGYALGNLAIQPMHREMQAVVRQVNETGGIHGRRLTYVDCDDGAPDPARTRACYKKLVEQEKVFAFMGGCTFTEAQFQADLERDGVPFTSPCSLYKEVWQNPIAFPIHMDMSQEAQASSMWAIKTQKPKTFGVLAVNMPESIDAAKQVEKVMAENGVKNVFKRVFNIGTPDMSGDVIAARAANPDVIVDYTIDPTVGIRFYIDAQQQNYWPPKGIHGNHRALEVVGGLMGEYPAKAPGGFWTNTTYKLWGADYIAWQRKYAPANKGLAHHVTQGQWFGANVTMECIRRVGPNLTRKAFIQCMYGQIWETDPGLGQKFLWEPSRRYEAGAGNTKEFMYKYVNKGTYAEDDGSGNPRGLVPDKDLFEIEAPAVNPHTGTGAQKGGQFEGG